MRSVLPANSSAIVGCLCASFDSAVVSQQCRSLQTLLGPRGFSMVARTSLELPPSSEHQLSVGVYERFFSRFCLARDHRRYRESIMSLTPQEIQYYKEHANDSLQPSIISSNAIGLGLAYIFVGLRVWARKKTKTQFGCDDWLIIAALAPLTTYAIVGWLQVSFGEGKHIIFVTNRAGFIQGYVTCIVAYAICVVLTKLSILCFYCRIFVPFKSLLYISWGFGIFIVAYNLALIFVAAFQCIPLSSMWTGRPGTCIDTLPPYTALG